MDDTADVPAKARRRGEILEAAFAEFSAKGYAGASMEAIARRARASKETLYAWFGNKETLLVRLFESRLAGVIGRAAAAARRDPSPANLLPVIAEDIMRLNLAIAPLNHSMEVGGASEAAARLIGRSIAEERQRFADYLLRCRAEGYIAFDDDPLEIASLFVVMAGGEWGLRLGTGMIAELTDRMIEDHARRVSRIFLRGLAPSPRSAGVPPASSS